MPIGLARLQVWLLRMMIPITALIPFAFIDGAKWLTKALLLVDVTLVVFFLTLYLITGKYAERKLRAIRRDTARIRGKTFMRDAHHELTAPRYVNHN